MTLTASGLGESYYNVNTGGSWRTTYANTFTFTKQSTLGAFAVPTLNQRATPTSEAGNDGFFNLWLNGWATFENGDSITYLITSSTSGLIAADFANLDSPTSGSYATGGQYSTAVFVNANSSPPTSSYYVGSTTIAPVPEPGIGTLLGVGLGRDGQKAPPTAGGCLKSAFCFFTSPALVVVLLTLCLRPWTAKFG